MKEIVECSIRFPDFRHEDARNPHSVILVFDVQLTGQRMLQLPQMIQDDETGDTSDFAREFRKSGVHLITAFKYVTATRTATFWMRKEVVAEWKRGEDRWAVGICRSEGWSLIGPSIVPS
jgi:hypothetical protein